LWETDEKEKIETNLKGGQNENLNKSITIFALTLSALIAFAIKENYSSDKKLKALSVMYKIKGYNPDGGDWFWAKYSPDGKVEASGKVKGCIDCHSKAKNNDFIFTGAVK